MTRGVGDPGDPGDIARLFLFAQIRGPIPGFLRASAVKNPTYTKDISSASP
jgi:hypothetical protein